MWRDEIGAAVLLLHNFGNVLLLAFVDSSFLCVFFLRVIQNNAVNPYVRLSVES